MSRAISHPTWCDLELCQTWTYPADPTEVSHHVILLDEARPRALHGQRVDVVQIDTLTEDGAGVARTSGPGVFVDAGENLTPAQARRVAAALAQAATVVGEVEAMVVRTTPPVLSRADRDALWVVAETPAEVAHLPLPSLLARWGGGTPVGPGDGGGGGGGGRPLDVARHHLDRLTAGQALVDHVTAGRWRVALDALRAGAELRTVARAMGMDTTEVVFGMRWWADGHLPTTTQDTTPGEDDRADVATLLGGAGEPA